EACYLYSLWGATTKMEQLQQEHPNLLRTSDGTWTPGTMMTTHTKPAALDILTVIKATQAISGEIVLEKLQQKLMAILIENAGAQRGSLIVEGHAFGENDYAKSVVNYVSRTLQSIVIGDASKDERYANDAYIRAHLIRSILCVPIVAQGKL